MSFSIRLLALLLFINLTDAVNLKNKVIAAVNCGGPEVVGAHGIEYSADSSEDGLASDHGMQFSFNNADPDDIEIYQTERWSKESFEYTVPAGDGEYVIILKFSEVYFQRVGEKVFHVRINSHLTVKNLDIFDAAGGRGYAYDIHLPVVIKGNQITIGDHTKDYKGQLVIEFAKGPHDNPKINAFAVVRGKIEDMPSKPEKFSPDSQFEEDFDIYEVDPREENLRPKITRGDEGDEDIEMYSPPTSETENPFEKKRKQESSNWWLGVVAALIIVIPIAYVLQIKFGAPIE